MERGVEQTDRHAVAVHDGHAVFEVGLRERIDGVESFLGLVLVIAEQDFLDERQTVAQEHVLGAEQAHTACTLVEGRLCFGGFSIGADFEGLDFLAPVENRLSGFFELRGNSHGDFAQVNFASRTTDRDVVTTFHGVTVAAEGTGCLVDRDFGGTDDGRNAPCGRHDGGVGNFRTGRGQNTTAGLHALDIFLARHDGHEDRVFLGGLGGKRFVLREADLATCGTRGCGTALGDLGCGLAVFRLDLREEELFKTFRIDLADRFFFREDAFLDEVVGDHGFGLCRTLAIANLEEIQRRHAVDLFHRKLGVLHVAAFDFEFLARGLEFIIDGVEGGIFVVAKRLKREAVADTGDDVFALRLEKDGAVELVVGLDAGALVAGEIDACRRTRRAVTEDHFLNVDCRADAVRNAFELAGEDGAFVVPAAENGFCACHDLFLRILREIMTIFHIDGLVAFDELGQIIGGQVDVGLGTFLFFEGVKCLFKRIFAVLVLDLLNNVAVHLKEAAIAVTPETCGVADGQRVNDLIGEADIENRVHHAGHREFRAGTRRNEQRVLRVAELLAGHFFHLFKASHDLILKGLLHVAVFEVIGMERRHVDDDRAADIEDAVHQVKAITFTAQKLLELILAHAIKFRNLNAFVEEISVFVLGLVDHVRKYSHVK